MTERTTKTEDELLMEQLCKDLAYMTKQFDNARIAKVSATQAVINYRSMIEHTLVAIKELERKGIKKVEVKEAEKETPAQQQIKPEVI